jgi:hypothetical protein
MNYTSVVMIGLFCIVLVLWFAIGKNFDGPKIDMEAIEALAIQGLARKRKFLGVEWRSPSIK